MLKVGVTIVLAALLIASSFTMGSSLSQPSSPKLRMLYSNAEARAITAVGYALIDGLQNPLISRISLRDDDAYHSYVFSSRSAGLFSSFKILADESIVAVGRVYTPSRGCDVLVARIGADGQVLWVRAFGEKDFDAGEDVLDLDGSLIVVGYSYSFGRLRSSDVLILKLDYLGAVLGSWVIGVEAYDDIAYKVQKTSDGGFLILGETWSYNVSLSDILLIKVDADAHVKWSRSIGGSSYEKAISSVEVSGEGFLVVGVSESFPLGNSDGFFLEVDDKGRLKYIRGVGWSGSDGLKDVCALPDRYVLLGYSSVRKDEGDMLILQIKPSGIVDRAYLLARKGFDSPHSVTVLYDQISVTGVISENETESLIVGTLARDWSNSTLRVFSQSKPSSNKFDLLKISDIDQHVVTGSWISRQLDLFIESVGIDGLSISVTVLTPPLNSYETPVDISEYIEKIDWATEIIRALESNIPLVILAIPFLTLFVAWMMLKMAKGIRKQLKVSWCPEK